MAQVPNKMLRLANTHEGPKYLLLVSIKRNAVMNQITQIPTVMLPWEFICSKNVSLILRFSKGCARIQKISVAAVGLNCMNIFSRVGFS